ncbi:hypothetical protein KEM52_003815, partial [Ascosphaera acerosa]
ITLELAAIREQIEAQAGGGRDHHGHSSSSFYSTHGSYHHHGALSRAGPRILAPWTWHRAWQARTLWLVIRYAASFVFAHLCWDVGMLVAALLVMRARGDRRLEEKLREAWVRIRRRVHAVRFYVRQFRNFTITGF